MTTLMSKTEKLKMHLDERMISSVLEFLKKKTWKIVDMRATSEAIGEDEGR